MHSNILETIAELRRALADLAELEEHDGLAGKDELAMSPRYMLREWKQLPMKKVIRADAFLCDEGGFSTLVGMIPVAQEHIGVEGISLKGFSTIGGNILAVFMPPKHLSSEYGLAICINENEVSAAWPTLPLTAYMGGLFTGTALWAVDQLKEPHFHLLPSNLCVDLGPDHYVGRIFYVERESGIIMVDEAVSK